MDELTKKPSQNIDVKYFQSRDPHNWMARINTLEEEFLIGPASITTLLNNVANLVRSEATYADLKVHGELPAVVTTAKEARIKRQQRYMLIDKAPEEPAMDTAYKDWADSQYHEADGEG